MAESTIITGQFVRISQTPASIGERLMALIIDYFLIGLYILSTITLLSKLSLPSGFSLFFFLCVVYLPILGYSFLCEMFNHGQSFGKKLINIRVVKVDGSTPSIGSYLLRWLLFPIDGPITSGLGLLVVLLNKNNQRLGDLAAGTMVIKEKNYRKIHVSLDEFDYLAKRLDSFDVGESSQFQVMAEKLNLTSMKALINLTFCCQQATVITDFTNLKEVGRDHYMNIHGGCASMEELEQLDGEETAILLIEDNEGTMGGLS